MDKPDIHIGTRGSKLALWQANWIKDKLLEHYPRLAVHLVPIKTKGDKILDVPLARVGGKGLFVKEIEEALLEGRVDLAVHSMKDMPADLPDGLKIGPMPPREVPSDVLISGNGKVLSDLRHGAKIGTSSLRRGAQLRHFRSDIEILPLRGNLDTRLRKLENPRETLDAIVLAAAGVRRLGLEHRVAERIDHRIMLPAAGQGALCLEIRKDDTETAGLLEILNHEPTRTAVMAERSFLNRLEGSCQVPIAAHCRIENGRLLLEGLVADLDGKEVIRDTHSGPLEKAEGLGVELAERLLSRGADMILESLSHHGN